MAKGIVLQPQVSKPATPNPTDVVVWVDSSNQLVITPGTDPDLNISEGVTNAAAGSTISAFPHESGVNLSKGQVVSFNNIGSLAATNVGNEASALSVIGVCQDNINDGAAGNVISVGRLENLTTSLSVGDLAFLSKTGTLTNTKPSIGVDGFGSGDWVIKVGVIVSNNANPANKDLLVLPQVIAQL
jgi:hypothetical protein